MRNQLCIFFCSLIVAPIMAVAQQYPNQCFDYTDLTAANVVCHFAQAADGDTVHSEPTEDWPHTGVRTGDPIWENIHHNVIEPGAVDYFNTPPTFPTFGDSVVLTMFHQVPPGFERSVRLGNYYNGGSSSNIEYTFRVDTTCNPILVLRLAPILEASHAYGSGCMFYVKDQDGNMLDASCNSMKFRLEGSTMTGSMPGNPKWQQQDDYFFLDWATLGLDLSPYHGQVITLVFQAWDCSRGQHVGMLYYVVENFEKKISVYTCEADEGQISLSAPEGFFYHWYRSNQPGVVLSQNRTFVVATGEDGDYACDCAVDTNFTCKFTLKATAIARYPKAQVDYDLRHGLCADTLWVHNTSIDCDSVLWDFGGGLLPDGTTPDPHQFDFVEPIIYATEGDHTVRLIACLKDFACSTDTSVFSFHSKAQLSNQVLYDTICQGTSIHLGTKTIVMTSAGDSLVQWQENSDSGLIHIEWHIHAEPAYEWETSDTICLGNAYHWRGNDYTVAGVYYDSLLSIHGCDSVYVLRLTVAQRYDKFGGIPDFWDDPYVTPLFPVDTICDTESYNWHGHILTEAGYYHDTLQTKFGCDSVVYLHLEVKECGCPTYPTSDTLVYIHAKDAPYLWHGDWYNKEGDYPKTLQDRQGCDSTALLRLRILDDCTLIPIISKTRNKQ